MPDSTVDGDSRFSIRRRLTVLAGVLLATLIAASLVAVDGVRDWERGVADRRSARDANVAVAELGAGLAAQEAAVRSFLLSGQARDRESYLAGRAQSAAALAQLRALPAGALDPLVTALDAVVAAWRTDDVDPLIAARESGAAIDPALVEASRAGYESVRFAFDELERRAHAEVDRLDAHVQDVQRRAVAALVVTLVVAFGGTLLLMELFRRWVTNALRRIENAARAIGSGEDVVAPDLASRELHAVWEAIDFLQASLTEERDRAVRAYSALAQSAVLALQVRSELAAHERLDVAEGWSLASTLRPAEGVVAGDCYDVGFINPEELYLVAIDVTGHGPLAALNALKAKSMLRSALKSGMQPGEALGWLATLGAAGSRDYFTAMVATVRVRSGRGRFANAGHPAALVLGAADAPVELPATGPIVGPFEATWATESFAMPPGSTLLIYTDGLTDVSGEDGERLGEERVLEAVTGDGPLGAAEVIERLEGLFDRFRSGLQADDLTLLALDHAAVDETPG